MTATRPSPAAASQSRPAGKLRLAFIGAGNIANTHLDALSKFPDVEVVALADTREEPMLEKVEKFGIPRSACFADYEEMLKQVQPDAVNICTPNGVHAPSSIAASQAGCHVIVEKPMAMTAAECHAMIQAARQAGRKLVIGFQYRYDPRTQFLRRVADEGRFGDMMYGRVQALRRRGIPNWGVFGRKDLQGGGPLIDIGVHVLEMCHYTMGSPRPVAATGMARTYLGNRDSTSIRSNWAGWDHKTYTVEDLAIGQIQFDNGAVIHVEAMFAGHIEKDAWDFQLMGTRGGGTWADPKLFADDHGHMLDIAPAWVGDKSFSRLFELKLRNFVDHILHDAPTAAPAEHGLMVQQMLDAIYQSSEQGGRQVTIEKLV